MAELLIELIKMSKEIEGITDPEALKRMRSTCGSLNIETQRLACTIENQQYSTNQVVRRKR